MAEVVEVSPEIPVFTDLKGSTIPELPKKPGTEPETPAEGGSAQKAPEAPADKAPAASSDKTEPDTDEQPDRPGKSRYQRRLDKAYRERAEWKAKAEFLAQQNAALTPKETPTGVPRLEDFSDVQEYAKAYAKYESENAVKEFQAKQREESFKRMQQHLLTSWEQKATRGEKKYDDFDEAVGDLNPDNPISLAIMQAENGEDIAHYLGTHPKEAIRIAQLDEFSQAREIGRLEAKLLADPPKPKTVSKAPAPIVPISGTATPSGNEPSETDDDATWIRKRQKQVHGR